ncbi:MAG: B12-binding domain-containing radical SAM protein [Acidobacteria bacterium]|nr:B12-binding domain-containing radical SAM protein [Acidobacteriota bacterium]
MRILLYNPDNGVTRNFMPHLWMFLLKSLTPPEHEVLLIDGNAKPMNEQQLVRFARQEKIGLVGIGAMTRMIARAYSFADALRAAGIPVVMGGPHVTELPDEALGRDGGLRHADAVALGEADETWPRIVADAAEGKLKEIYEPVDESGKERKPSLKAYPVIPWDTIDLDQFNLIPRMFRRFTEKQGSGWKYLNMMPIESGRGCPYGCEFCTVTGFFGDSIRFRTNESVVNELLMLKRRARSERGQISVFFIDDNFAINIKRTKSLLRDIIAAEAQLPWTAQISANLLRDEELVDLIAASGGKWIFIGMESLDAVNLSDVNKSFSKPEEYEAVLNRLAQRNIYAITSFILGLDNDTPGVADRMLEHIERWPPGLPVFSPLTPLPGTPLYERLKTEGRLTRPKHWLNFAQYKMSHVPLKITIAEAQQELDTAWRKTYSPQRNKHVTDMLTEQNLNVGAMHFLMRLFFRGIYVPQMTKRAWLSLIVQNRKSILKLLRNGVVKYREHHAAMRATPVKRVNAKVIEDGRSQ